MKFINFNELLKVNKSKAQKDNQRMPVKYINKINSKKN